MPNRDYYPPVGHATHIAAIVAGKHLGVAPKTHVVSVQEGDSIISEMISSLTVAYQDIKKNGRHYKSVIVASSSFEDGEYKTEQREPLKDIIMALMKLGVPVVVCSGNNALSVSTLPPEKPRSELDTIPGLFVQEAKYPLIIVGSVDDEGARCDFSQGGEKVTITAGGCKIPLLTVSGKIRQGGGTSFCKEPKTS